MGDDSDLGRQLIELREEVGLLRSEIDRLSAVATPRGASPDPTSGNSWGLHGVTQSDDGWGVVGTNGSTAAGVHHGGGVSGSALKGGTGVAGVVSGDFGNGIGVSGRSDGRGTGVRGESTNGHGLVGIGGGDGVAGSFAGGRASLNLWYSGDPPLESTTWHEIGDIYRDFPAGDLWYCTETGVPGTWVKLNVAGLIPVTPFRVYDSRFGDGPLARGANRLVSMRDSIDTVTGKLVKKNALPAGATAIMFNLVITNTVGGGFLAATPGGATKSSSASINWSGSGETSNNGAFVRLDGARRMRAFVDGTPGARTDFIVDVTGYLTTR